MSEEKTTKTTKKIGTPTKTAPGKAVNELIAMMIPDFKKGLPELEIFMPSKEKGIVIQPILAKMGYQDIHMKKIVNGWLIKVMAVSGKKERIRVTEVAMDSPSSSA